MEGVMMRNADGYGLAVRRADGTIVATRRAWVEILKSPWLRVRGLRGFPVLVETLYNGIGSLNRSVALAGEGEGEDLSRWQTMLSMLLAVVMALALFVVTPHLLSVVMYWLSAGGDVDGLSFHLWDGFFKVCIFLGYIRLISIVPEIRRVFRYHGAEHKTIHAFEKEDEVSAATAARMSRLHPRCGTTFLLFVISISIVLHAVLVPLGLWLYTPGNAVLKHALTVAFKLLLIVPISALSYEVIRYAARLRGGLWAAALQSPGLALQRLTTAEPETPQLEVAVIALNEALDGGERDRVVTVPYVKQDETAIL
ncbi:MAG: DUF1385 domain-containing protein [Desulfovibrio sp.]|nr:DUF1385 domain-containing protein [Desulfovibrio sp.]